MAKEQNRTADRYTAHFVAYVTMWLWPAVYLTHTPDLKKRLRVKRGDGRIYIDWRF